VGQFTLIAPLRATRQRAAERRDELAPLHGAPLRAAHYHTVAQEGRCASQQKLRDDVADGSDSAVPRCPRHVRSTSNICRDVAEPRRQLRAMSRHMRCSKKILFDHFVGPYQERFLDLKAKRLRSFEIDRQPELG
jgi:hypothetical protein